MSDKVEKRLHYIEDQIIGMQLSNLSGNNLSGKAVTSESFLYVNIIKNDITLMKIKIMTPYMEKKALKASNKLVTIGDSMLNNINSRGISKSKGGGCFKFS